MGQFAWVTLATNDSYALGALVVAFSLKKVNTAHQLAVLITPGVTSAMREKLQTVFNVVQEVNVLDSKDAANLALLSRPELGITFTKLHCWNLTQFEKCVFLDADTFVLQNCDELFDREELSAAPDVGWPDCFNSGVFVYRPNADTFEKLTQFAVQKGSFDGGDQGLLNLYFANWASSDSSKRLPFVYNTCSTACYSYLPAFKQFGDNVKILHFIGQLKPWVVNFDPVAKKANPPQEYKHLGEYLDLWWNLFCAEAHPKLTTDMNSNDRPHNEQPRWYENPQLLYVPPAEYLSESGIETRFVDPWEDYYEKQNDNNNGYQQHNYDDGNVTCTIGGGGDCSSSNYSFDYNLNDNNYNEQSTNNQTNHSQTMDLKTTQEPMPIEVPFFNDNSTANIDTHEQYQHNNNYHHEQHEQHQPQHQNQNQCHEQMSTKEQNHEENRPEQQQQQQHQHEQHLSITSNPIECPLIEQSSDNFNHNTNTHTNNSTQEHEHEHEHKHEHDQDQGGLAGALAGLRLGQARTAEQEAYENNCRRHCWEHGSIDYLGKDSFDNIWKQIAQTLESKNGSSATTSERRARTPTPQPEDKLPKDAKKEDITVTPSPVSTVTVTRSERKMSSVALIELHKSFEGAETEAKPQAETEPETEAKSQAETGPETQVEAKPEEKPESEPEPKPEPKPEPESKPTVTIPAAEQAQPGTPTVTSPSTPPATASSPVVKESPAVGELKAEHDIPSTPPVGKSAPAKPTKK